MNNRLRDADMAEALSQISCPECIKSRSVAPRGKGKKTSGNSQKRNERQWREGESQRNGRRAAGDCGLTIDWFSYRKRTNPGKSVIGALGRSGGEMEAAARDRG
jgi:hypothetical protein